uniref:AMP-binding protein n=1 Tax=Actinoalloteichus spitiensis TaxID=252394 RepID=UPI0003687169
DSTLPAHPPSPDAAAYVMYTSGSTGRPKGVVVPHSALATVLRFCQDTRFPRHGRYRVATTASTSFDISWDGPLWLAGGHEVHVIGDTERRDPHALVSYVERHRVDCLNITPTHCRELLAAGLLDPERAYRPRLVVLCGEPVPKPLWTALRRAAPHTEVLNSYGITECGVENLVTPLSDWEEPALGDPAADTGIHLLGGTLEPGDHGELHVTGSCLARGYLGRPALTAQRFVANPFGPPGTRMYRTGDLAVRDHRGRFVSRGRTDGQVKLRGVRIELGEIESALEDHTGVEQAAVVLTRGTHPTLVASVVGTASPEQLRAHLANRLPSAMLPARIQTVDRLPRTVSGKTDRAALAAHEGPGATGDAGRRDEGVPPGPGRTRPGSVQGSTEVPARRPGADHLVGPHVGRADKRPAPSRPDVDELRELFGEMLERGPVRADDDFFDLGGHSLLAARLVRRVSARTGHELPVTTFFDASTPARLAARLAQPARPAERPVVLPLRTGGGTAPLICVHPAGGTGTLYSPLVPHLHRDRPVSALQSRHQGSAVLESTGSLVELAADYRGEIQAHQPHGPYHLLGWSFGGVLAHEIAVQLQREGHQVATLALFDAYPDDGAVPALTTDQLREALRDIRHFAEDELDLVAPVIQHHQAMTRAHTPGVFDGNVLFLHATEERPEGAPHPSVWAPHVSGDLVTHELQCTHQGLTRPDILPRVARLLDGWARSTSGEGSAR